MEVKRNDISILSTKIPGRKKPCVAVQYKNSLRPVATFSNEYERELFDRVLKYVMYEDDDTETISGEITGEFEI